MNTPILLSEDQQSALLETIKTVCSIFRGPDALLCNELIERGFTRGIDPPEPLLAFFPPDTLKKANAVLTSNR